MEEIEYTLIPGKTSEITVDGKNYVRKACKVDHFVMPGEDYIEILREFVLPYYREGDFVSMSEKVIAICQKRVVYRKDLKVGFWAKFLSQFASNPPTGDNVHAPTYMAYCIEKNGLPKVLYAAVCSGVTKLFGIHGVFYEIVGKETAGLDGLNDHVWEEYKDMGVEIPAEPFKVCDEIREKLGMSCMIVDANDVGQEVFGYSSDLEPMKDILVQFVRDNPTGQKRDLTPFILMHKAD